MAKKPKTPGSEQSKRFIELARELELDDTEAGQEKVFGKVGMKKPKPKKKTKSKRAKQ